MAAYEDVPGSQVKELFYYISLMQRMQGNAHHICENNSSVIGEQAVDYIKWPSGAEMEEVVSRNTFSNTIGICATDSVSRVMFSLLLLLLY